MAKEGDTWLTFHSNINQLQIRICSVDIFRTKSRCTNTLILRHQIKECLHALYSQSGCLCWTEVTCLQAPQQHITISGRCSEAAGSQSTARTTLKVQQENYKTVFSDISLGRISKPTETELVTIWQVTHNIKVNFQLSSQPFKLFGSLRQERCFQPTQQVGYFLSLAHLYLNNGEDEKKKKSCVIKLCPHILIQRPKVS